jgi:hypothetical protein
MTRTNGDQQNNTDGVSTVRDVFMEFRNVSAYSGGGKICVRMCSSSYSVTDCLTHHICLTFRLPALLHV